MNKSFDQTGMTDDHHRNRMKSKKKMSVFCLMRLLVTTSFIVAFRCTGPRIAVSLLIIIIIVVAIILSVTLTLVLKPQSQATPSKSFRYVSNNDLHSHLLFFSKNTCTSMEQDRNNRSGISW